MTKKLSPPAKWQGPMSGLATVVFAAFGLYASIGLLMTEMQAREFPDSILGCDLNPLVGCSDSLLTPQAHLLGIPNSVLGIVAFSAMAALGAVLLFGGGLPRLVWWGYAAGAAGGIAFVIYFLVLSVAVFGSLCPFCMITWAAALGIVPIAWGGAAASGSFGKKFRQAGKSTLKYGWVIVLGLYLLVILVILLTMADTVRLLFI